MEKMILISSCTRTIPLCVHVGLCFPHLSVQYFLFFFYLWCGPDKFPRRKAWFSLSLLECLSNVTPQLVADGILMSRRGTAGVRSGLSDRVASSRDWVLLLLSSVAVVRRSWAAGYWMVSWLSKWWCHDVSIHSFLVTCLYVRRCRTCDPLLFLVSTPPWWLSKTNALHSPSKVLIVFLLETLWIGSCSDPLWSLNGLVKEFIDIVCLHQDLQYYPLVIQANWNQQYLSEIKIKTTHIPLVN